MVHNIHTKSSNSVETEQHTSNLEATSLSPQIILSKKWHHKDLFVYLFFKETGFFEKICLAKQGGAFALDHNSPYTMGTILKYYEVTSMMLFKRNFLESRIPQTLTLVIGLSWLYAICSQVTLWLPCLPVPISLQPLPLFAATLMVGWPAVNAYLLYLIQGAFGLPFFAGMQGGLMRLLGPTGGYLLGWLITMVLLALVRKHITKRWYTLLVCSWLASVIYFACGLWRLSSFVPAADLFAVGLVPFLVGDFVLKPLALLCLSSGFTLYCKQKK